jgi:hypothetical protein
LRPLLLLFLPISAASALPNLTPYQPAGWSGKIVVSNATGTNIDSSPLSPTDTLYVDWAVINNGTAATAARFYSEIYVDGVLKGTWSSAPPLNPNFYSYAEDFSIGSLPAGAHTVELKADTTAAIAESSESDNTLTKTITVAAPGGGCSPSATTLCLLSNRFKVNVSWTNQHSNPPKTGAGMAVPDTDQTGLMWFFSPDSIELVVKMVDGRAVNGRFWVFYGALSDVEYTIAVTDAQTGVVRTYHNVPGSVGGGADTSAFSENASQVEERPLSGSLNGTMANALQEDTAAFQADSENLLPEAVTPCVASSTQLCLLSNRFQVSVSWINQHPPGGTGVGKTIPATDQSGYFWFFSSNSIDLVVKIVDGRALNGSFWVFYGALSDVEYTVTVTDKQTGRVRTYHNAPGNISGGADTSFSTSSGTTAPTLTSLSSLTAAPFSILTIAGSGFDTTARTTIKYFDSTGYSVNVPGIVSTSGAVSVAVPPYSLQSTHLNASGVVSVQAVVTTAQGATLASNILNGLRINALPALTLPPGTVTANFLTFLRLSLGQLRDDLSNVEAQSNGSVSFAGYKADLSNEMAQLSSLETTIRNKIVPAAASTLSTVTVDGLPVRPQTTQAITYDPPSLTAMDQGFLGVIQSNTTFVVPEPFTSGGIECFNLLKDGLDVVVARATDPTATLTQQFNTAKALGRCAQEDIEGAKQFGAQASLALLAIPALVAPETLPVDAALLGWGTFAIELNSLLAARNMACVADSIFAGANGKLCIKANEEIARLVLEQNFTKLFELLKHGNIATGVYTALNSAHDLIPKTDTALVQLSVTVPTVVSIQCSPSTFAVAQTSLCTLTVDLPPFTNTVIPLTTSAPGVVSVPFSMTVYANDSSGTFVITGLANGTATISSSGTTSNAVTVGATPLNISGSWSGSWTGSWSGTCTWNDGGSLAMKLTQNGSSVAGTNVSAAGFQIKSFSNCSLLYTDSASGGTASGTLSGATFNFVMHVTGAQSGEVFSFSGVGTVSGNTMTGTLVETDFGGNGSFTLTRH